MPHSSQKRASALGSAALSAVLLAACASDAISPWEPLRWEETSVSSYVGSGRDPVDPSVELPSVSVAGGRVELSGVIITPDPCVEISVDASTLTQVMEVDIVVRRPPHSGCATVPGAFQYTATARHPSGSYRLRVAHRYPAASSNQRRVVLDTIISIP